MADSLKTSNHSAYSLHYRIVLSVKYRHKCLTGEMLGRLHTVFLGASKSWRCRLLEFGGEADHVHLLVEAHPSMNLAQFAGNPETVSSCCVRKEFAGHLRKFFWKTRFWSSAYAAVSAGGHANIKQLLAYIQAQDTPL